MWRLCLSAGMASPGPGLVSPSKGLLLSCRNKATNGDCRKDPRERSRSPIERAVAPTMGLHGGHLYASLPSLGVEQPLALTKSSGDTGRAAGLSPTLTHVERQQVHTPVRGQRLGRASYLGWSLWGFALGWDPFSLSRSEAWDTL